MSRRWKENILRNWELTLGGRIMSQPYEKLRSWNACLHLTQGVAYKVSSETWNCLKLTWFYTALQLWKSQQISQNRPQKPAGKLCGAMTLASRDHSCGSMAARCGSAGRHTAVSAQPEPGGPADRPHCWVLLSKPVMKREPANRQKYRAVKGLHKFGCEAIRQPQ